MKAPIESPLTLEAVAEHFEQWRSNKKKGERIPEQLWSEAIDLVGTYGVSQVTRTLRLGGADLNKRRGIVRYVAAVARWFQKEATVAEPDFQDSPVQQWEAQTVWQAVQQLSRSDQEIIYLRFFLELSVAETADAVGIAPGTVKSRLHRALNRLRQVIAQEFPDLQAERTR